MAKLILVVDDDALLRRSLTFDLDKSGYRVKTAASAEDGLLLAVQDPPDLILLDIGLPGMDGLQALRCLQAQISAPVIFLTARRRPFDEVLGLELGACDYITKPFDTDILLARVKSVLRRSEPSQPAPKLLPLSVGDLFVDPAGRTITLDGRQVDLPPRAFDLLYVLAARQGEVVSIENLLSQVWGVDHSIEPQAIYVHMRWLREKLEDDPNRPCRLITVHGVGYKLVPREPGC